MAEALAHNSDSNLSIFGQSYNLKICVLLNSDLDHKKMISSHQMLKKENTALWRLET